MRHFPVTVTYRGTDTIKRLYAEACYPEELFDEDLAVTLLIVGGGRCRVSGPMFPRLWRKFSSDNHFPQDPPERTGEERLDVRLVSFGEAVAINGGLGRAGVYTRLKEMGLRGLTVAELYAFGARYRQEQKKYPIIGVGQGYYMTLSGSHVVGLTVSEGCRVTEFFPTNVRLDKSCRFAATPIKKK
jgi:hypothetical protein